MSTAEYQRDKDIHGVKEVAHIDFDFWIVLGLLDSFRPKLFKDSLHEKLADGGSHRYAEANPQARRR